jgi:hypothetical protein
MVKVSMDESVRVPIVLLMLMEVLKRRLNKSKGQHEGRQDGGERPHTVILHSLASEFDLQVELHAPRRLRSYGMAEERRSDHPDIGHVIRMV